LEEAGRGRRIRNRGIVSEFEAMAPAAAVNATVGVGAKLIFTVAVPTGGALAAALAVYTVHTPKERLSVSRRIVVDDSQTAVAELVGPTESSAKPWSCVTLFEG